jgi:putative glutamine amidotransferase
MLCIGLSWRGAHNAYDAYETALRRRAQAQDLAVEIRWLAGRDRPVATGVLPLLAGVVFTGGPDVAPERYGETDPKSVCQTDPERDAAEFALLEHFQANPLPTLAICRGAQIVNVFNGGTLVQDLGALNAVHEGSPDKHHPVHVASGTQMERIARSTVGTVNSSHHQAVGRLARPFRLSAAAPDGTVEAYEYADVQDRPFFLALQWHPERMQAGLALSDGVLDAFIRAL